MDTITKYTVNSFGQNSSSVQRRPLKQIKKKHATYENTLIGVSSIADLTISEHLFYNIYSTINPINSIYNTIRSPYNSSITTIFMPSLVYKNTPKKVIKAKLKAQYTPDDTVLTEKLHHQAYELIDDKEINDYRDLVKANSGKLMNGLEKWL